MPGWRPACPDTNMSCRDEAASTATGEGAPPTHAVIEGQKPCHSKAEGHYCNVQLPLQRRYECHVRRSGWCECAVQRCCDRRRAVHVRRERATIRLNRTPPGSPHVARPPRRTCRARRTSHSHRHVARERGRRTDVELHVERCRSFPHRAHRTAVRSLNASAYHSSSDQIAETAIIAGSWAPVVSKRGTDLRIGTSKACRHPARRASRAAAPPRARPPKAPR